MATYAIGDVQGCFDELQKLLEHIHFDSNNDNLWFAGDLINRGPASLEVLRFIKQLKNTVIVLGNHDLHLLALAHGHSDYDPSSKKFLTPILQAPDCDELIDWLRHQPFLHMDKEKNALMTHAGIYPLWSLEDTKHHANELETLLQSDQFPRLLKEMYGDAPHKWSNDLTGWDRIRFIINAFTRMRLVSKQGTLELNYKGTLKDAPKNYLPWYELLNTSYDTIDIIFGHWAALEKQTIKKNIFAIDTGCVWGRTLTALRLEDKKLFHVPGYKRNTY